MSQLLQRPTFDALSSTSNKPKPSKKVLPLSESPVVESTTEQDIIDLLSGNSRQTPSELDTQVLNRSFQSLFSQELDTDETLRAFEKSGPQEKRDDTPVDQILKDENTKCSADSPMVSAIKPVIHSEDKSNEDKQEAKSSGKKCRRSIQSNILDDIIADSHRNKDERKNKQLLQTSTPLRPTNILEQSDQRMNAASVNETKDSGFPVEPVVFKSLRTETDNSASLLNMSLHSRSDNISLNQPSMKILCQWKGRVLLIPIPR